MDPEGMAKAAMMWLLGKAANAALKPLVDKVRAWAMGAPKTAAALEQAEAEPNRELAADELRVALRRRLNDDPAAAAALAEILRELAATGVTQTASGDGNVQIVGDRNHVVR